MLSQARLPFVALSTCPCGDSHEPTIAFPLVRTLLWSWILIKLGQGVIGEELAIRYASVSSRVIQDMNFGKSCP